MPVPAEPRIPQGPRGEAQRSCHARGRRRAEEGRGRLGASAPWRPRLLPPRTTRPALPGQGPPRPATIPARAGPGPPRVTQGDQGAGRAGRAGCRRRTRPSRDARAMLPPPPARPPPASHPRAAGRAARPPGAAAEPPGPPVGPPARRSRHAAPRRHGAARGTAGAGRGRSAGRPCGALWRAMPWRGGAGRGAGREVWGQVQRATFTSVEDFA